MWTSLCAGSLRLEAKSDTEGEVVCHLCGKETLPSPLGDESLCDRVCAVCGQRYHSDCLSRISNAISCPRCRRKDVLVVQ